MSVIDQIGKARYDLLERGLTPARVWLDDETWSKLIYENHAHHDPKQMPTVFGLPVTLSRNTQPRVIAEDGTAINLDSPSPPPVAEEWND